MSVQICTAEYMISRFSGTGFSQAWLPDMVAERMLPSGRDGTVDRAPDQIPFIEGEILYANPYNWPIHAMVSVHRASRFLLSSNPNTLVLDDVWTTDIGVSPSAPAPTGTGQGFGVRIQQNRSSQTPLIFARIFANAPDRVAYVDVGEIGVGESVHFRYRCMFSTPGNWRTPTEPRHEANAYWARLRLWSAPMVGSI